jgi:oxygen-independent coproporphyrinogen-3 oxidase
MASAATGAVASDRLLAPEELAVEFFLNVMRLTEGVPMEQFEARTGLTVPVIAEPLARARALGLMLDDPQRLQPSPLGLRFLNDLLVLFEPD